RMKAAAEKAVTLDSTLGEAYISLAMCAVYYDWDWSAAESAFRKGLQLDPNNANSRIAYSCFMLPTGRIEDSIRDAKRAVEIEPLYVHARSWLGIPLLCERRYDEAILTMKSAIEMDERFLPAYICLGITYEAKGERAKAIEFMEKVGMITAHPLALGMRGWIYGLDGRVDEARRMLNE